MKDLTHSIHPYAPFIPANATKLIIGTIPPARFCSKSPKLEAEDVNFYYGSRDNYFWEIIGEITKTQLAYENTEQAIEQRKSVLKKLNAGITDNVKECDRIGNAASDDSLVNIKFKDISGLLKEYSGITTLIYTSEFVKKRMNQLLSTYHSIDRQNPKKQNVNINGKVYEVRILFSPSPSGLRNLGPNGKTKRIEQYKDFLIRGL